MTLKEILEASRRFDSMTDPNDVLKELSKVVTNDNTEKEKEEGVNND